MRFALVFDTKEELDKAAAAVAALKGSTHGPSHDGVADLAKRLEAALAMSPLNIQKATLLKTWLRSPQNDWVPFSTVVDEFKVSGIAVSTEQAGGRASAAIRDLSWQIAQTLPADHLEKFDKAIEALSSRSRAGGTFSYRLTPAGRIATERFLKNAEIA